MPCVRHQLTRLGETPEHAHVPRPQVEAAPRKAPKPQLAAGPAPEDISAPLTIEVTAYCVKCKTNRPMDNGMAVYMANGRPAARGECSVCGTGLFKIGATSDHDALPKPVVGARSNTGQRGESKAAARPVRESRRRKRSGSKAAAPASTRKPALRSSAAASW